MKTGIKNAGSDLQVAQETMAVRVWQTIERVSTEAATVPVASTTSPVQASEPLSPAMEQGMRVARSQPEIRTALVEALVTEIAAGTYFIDSKAIAQKMLK
ncbi:MAG TPA: flagellar biosynthesis anti-sigma factor FlgM [Ktedonobacteraceae bacterium]|nr:flagellar biosynthesis anti-sigma factor FlgM [Ktedonobacteraceae bacterium]